MSVAAVLMLALLSFYTVEATITSDDSAVHLHFHLNPDDDGRGDERPTIQKEEKSTKDAFEQENKSSNRGFENGGSRFRLTELKTALESLDRELKIIAGHKRGELTQDVKTALELLDGIVQRAPENVGNTATGLESCVICVWDGVRLLDKYLLAADRNILKRLTPVVRGTLQVMNNRRASDHAVRKALELLGKVLREVATDQSGGLALTYGVNGTLDFMYRELNNSVAKSLGNTLGVYTPPDVMNGVKNVVSELKKAAHSTSQRLGPLVARVVAHLCNISGTSTNISGTYCSRGKKTGRNDGPFLNDVIRNVF